MNNFLPGLYIVSTPIGNLEDITLRALNVLKNSKQILCEDTRRSLKLLNHYKIKKKLISYHKFNEKSVAESVINFISKGNTVSIICDAGTPTLSDPGMLLVRKCIKNKINVYPIPGASAITTAMSVSGFEEKYFFYGFLPKKNKEIEKALNELENLNSNIVFFIPAIKINFYIKYFKKFFKSRELFIGREMTKIYETFYRENLEKFNGFKNSLKGELTVILSKKTVNNSEKKLEDIDNLTTEIVNYMKKYTLKDVVKLISEKNNLPKKQVYNLCLKIKKK
tara:strand:+ start:273 stop:1112 length:840 start_codon:yes stop_codon:yes gene_type:complete